jgi:hypothetical protein
MDTLSVLVDPLPKRMMEVKLGSLDPFPTWMLKKKLHTVSQLLLSPTVKVGFWVSQL